jgi:Mor family transcriptional regulator
MQIKDAIRLLKEAQNRGARHVVINWWESSNFNLPEGKAWEEASRQAGIFMDWDSTSEDLSELVGQAIQSQHNTAEYFEKEPKATPKLSTKQR